MPVHLPLVRTTARRPRRHVTAAVVLALLVTGVPALVAPGSGATGIALAATPAQAGDDTTEPGDESVPTVTVNEFLPTDRDLSECLSALPRPGCGSEARGGWRQTAIFVAMLGGLAFIAWRIVASSRRARAALAEARPTDGDPTA